MDIDRNAHLQTQLETYIYANLTLANRWTVKIGRTNFFMNFQFMKKLRLKMLSVSHSTFSFLVSLSSGLVEMTCFLRGLGSGKPLDNRSPTQTGFQGSQMVLEEKIVFIFEVISRGMMDRVTRQPQHSVKSFLAAERLIFILLIKVIKSSK